MENTNKIGRDFSLFELLKFSFPSILNNFFAQLFKTLDDGLFVSRFVGKTALAGINILNPMNFFQFSLNNLFAVGAPNLSSRKMGEGDQQEAKRIFTRVCISAAVIGGLFALLLNEVGNKLFKRTVQTVTYLPHFLSMVIVVGMAQNIFASNGAINQLLMTLGMKEPIFFLGEGKYFWWLVGVINVWKEVGWNTIIYISAMTSIDPALYEAASIDGAGRFQKIMHVTLPGIKSTFVILLIMNIGHLMEAGFEIQYLLGNGLTAAYSRTIDVFVLEYGTQQMDFGVATAAGIFKSVVAIILLVGANFISKRLGEDTLV